MTKTAEERKQKLKEMQKKNREKMKREKEKIMKVELEEMKVELEGLKAFKKENELYLKVGKQMNDLLVKNGVKSFEDGFKILENAIVSMKG